MDKLKTRVRRLLENKPDTRKNYRLLVVMIWEEELHSLNVPMTQFLFVYGSTHYTNQLSSAASITRCARELFNEFPHLKDKDTYMKRKELAEEMRQKYSNPSNNRSHPTRYNDGGFNGN